MGDIFENYGCTEIIHLFHKCNSQLNIMASEKIRKDLFHWHKLADSSRSAPMCANFNHKWCPRIKKTYILQRKCKSIAKFCHGPFFADRKTNKCKKMLLQDVAPAVETGMLAQHKDVKAIEAKNTCLNSDTTLVNCGRSRKHLHG